MKYAIISDVHANLEALEAVLAAMRPHADTVICLGDIVGYNANPNECLELVRNVCDVVIAGNSLLIQVSAQKAKAVQGRVA